MNIESGLFKLKGVSNDPGCVYNYDGFCKEAGLLGMLEAMVYSQLGSVSGLYY